MFCGAQKAEPPSPGHGEDGPATPACPPSELQPSRPDERQIGLGDLDPRPGPADQPLHEQTCPGLVHTLDAAKLPQRMRVGSIRG